jgi:hypothetical protein
MWPKQSFGSVDRARVGAFLLAGPGMMPTIAVGCVEADHYGRKRLEEVSVALLVSWQAV